MIGRKRVSLAQGVCLGNDVLHATFRYQCYGGAEGTQLFKMRHVDAVVVGVSYLRRTADHDNLLGMQAVENLQDTLLQGRAAHNAVIDNYQVVLPCLQRAVCYVIYMCGKVVASVALADEGAQFYVLPYHFLYPDAVVNAPYPVRHAIECHLCRVRDIREDRMLYVTVDSLHDGRGQLFPQLLTFPIDVAVTATAEVYAFEAACAKLLLRDNLLQPIVTVPTNYDSLPRLQFPDIVGSKVKARLYNRTLRSNDDNLLILIPKCRTYAPRVANGKHLAAAGNATHHISAIKAGHRGAQDICHLYVFIYIAGDVPAVETFVSCNTKQSLCLAVKTMPHQLKHYVGIAARAW